MKGGTTTLGKKRKLKDDGIYLYSNNAVDVTGSIF